MPAHAWLKIVLFQRLPALRREYVHAIVALGP
jgi:hypothetical protein